MFLIGVMGVTGVYAQDKAISEIKGYEGIREIVLSRAYKAPEPTMIERRKQAIKDVKDILCCRYQPVLPITDEYKRYSLVLDFFNDAHFTACDSYKIDLNNQKISDFLMIGKSLQDSSVYSVITEAVHTSFGKIFALRILLNPTADITVLKNRAALTKALVGQAKQHDQFDIALKNIKSHEDAYFAFCTTGTAKGPRESLIDQQYSLKNLNKQFGGYLPFLDKLEFFEENSAYKQMSYIANTSFITFLVQKGMYSAVWPEMLTPNFVKSPYFQASYMGVMVALHCLGLRQQEKVLNHMHAQLNGIASMLRSMKALDRMIQANPELKNRLTYAEDLHALFDANNTKTSGNMRKLIALLATKTFKSKPTFFSLRGRVLAAYAIMEEIKGEFARALHAIGEVDAYCGIAQLYKEHENTDLPYVFVDYIENSTTPILALNDMWNPLINVATSTAHKVVKNSIALGVNGSVRNVIITGPNAGGKSTFMKGVGINVVLAQTFGIACAASFSLTPFSIINSYMNIVDDLAKGESLFMAEVRAAHALYQSINTLDSKKFSFAVVDEMFSGTSPKEGEDATYSIAKKTGAFANSVLLLATHYPKLKLLADETKTFKNCQVRVVRHEDGTITYPFKLEDGFATQNIAFDILKQQGFSSTIFDDLQEQHQAVVAA